ncbi:TauD/TfdA family dioxygenase [Streptomyces sp. AP-93]|uniref:TauD/TfdA family dioxygenase n=1 Tax=Streptomyces sp. AP-93 TaxID=2929048 RepID=UPI001FAFB615|nr:TauD/TfdA family dioxygenase [Streptomyces sp. AP-93]MCJ0868787.1 TauD/TfdA family dioxygenase [Streptomyces sp. AP-93]
MIHPPTEESASDALRITRFRLDDGTRDVLGKEIGARTHSSVLDSDDNQAILSSIGAYVLRQHLPGQILDALESFRVSRAHALTLSNLPRQDLPATPVSGYGDEPALSLVNAVHFGLIQLLGMTPYAVNYENLGRLMRNVVPNPAASGTTSSWGADSEFFWHTDNPHLPFGEPGMDPRGYVPQYLTFYTARNEERVPTEIAAAEEMVRLLDPAVLRALEGRGFVVGAPDSNDFPESPELLDEAPLLERDATGRHRVRYDAGTTRGISAEAEQHLRSLHQALGQVRGSAITLDPGDFLVFDNYRVVHRRRAFTPALASTARWLRRCYAS